MFVHEVQPIKADEGPYPGHDPYEFFTSVLAPHEILFPEVRRNSLRLLLFVDSEPGLLKDFCGNVRREDGKPEPRKSQRTFVQHHGERIGLFTRRTAGAPDGELLPRSPGADIFGEHGFREKMKVYGFTKEIGFVRGHGVDHLYEFVFAVPIIEIEQVIAVFLEQSDAEALKPLLESRLEHGLFGWRHFDPALGAYKLTQAFELTA